jgi:hypothetical protein
VTRVVRRPPVTELSRCLTPKTFTPLNAISSWSIRRRAASAAPSTRYRRWRDGAVAPVAHGNDAERPCAATIHQGWKPARDPPTGSPPYRRRERRGDGKRRGSASSATTPCLATRSTSPRLMGVAARKRP